MRDEAASRPTIETLWGRFSALQIVTLVELAHDHRPKLPPLISMVKKAVVVETRTSHQNGSQIRCSIRATRPAATISSRQDVVGDEAI
ncbi:hypothetical protein [Sphingomonas sp. PB4P5]|uniref:hypothetical protein n=1 Tax=Parasphingomonas puruogangriensis TaxID=3096155 RepID=UPI002FC66EFD